MGCSHSYQSNSSIFISKELENKLNITKNIKQVKEETKEGLLEELSECSICLENINSNKIIKTDCFHYFHKECLDIWVLYKNNCPLCREYLNNYIIYNYNYNYYEIFKEILLIINFLFVLIFYIP